MRIIQRSLYFKGDTVGNVLSHCSNYYKNIPNQWQLSLIHTLIFVHQVIMFAPEDVAEKGITLLKEIFTNLGPRLQQDQVEIHKDFMLTTKDRMKALYDTISVLQGDKESTKSLLQETTRMIRVLTVLKEYVNECDEQFGEERSILPLSR